MAWTETLLFYKESPYQKIAFFTESDGSFSLTLNDFWQFNSGCEHIYHECLFTMPGLFPEKLENVLVLGGGDGLGARELLKYKTVKRIDLVDLDPEIIKFAKNNAFMKSLNKGSFNNPKVNITVTDAKKWLAKKPTTAYDLIIIDFPDPTSDDLWELYTAKLYKQVAARLSKNGTVAIQSSTYNTKTFELIFDRLNKVFPFIIGYHTGASSVFCGFFLCSFKPVKMARSIPEKCRWINPKIINQILALPVVPANETAKQAKLANNKIDAPQYIKNLTADKKIITFGENNEDASDVPEVEPLASDEFFRTKEVVDKSVITGSTGPSVMSNPLVIGGILLVAIIPLILTFILGKEGEK